MVKKLKARERRERSKKKRDNVSEKEMHMERQRATIEVSLFVFGYARLSVVCTFDLFSSLLLFVVYFGLLFLSILSRFVVNESSDNVDKKNLNLHWNN
jgi:hypothetical protein